VSGRPPLRVLAGVGLVAGCTLALPVVLTRILSAVLAYHFGFLAISLALLGVGAGAIVVYVRPAWFDGPVEPRLAAWSGALAASLVLVPAVIVRLDFAGSLRGEVTPGFAFTLGAACLLAAIPFVLAGTAIALAVRAYTGWIGRVYAFDLAGAGLGALAAVPVLWLVSGPELLVALAALAALAALLFAGPAAAARRLALAATAVAAVGVVLASATTLYELPPHTTAPGTVEPVSDRWTPLSRVLGYPPAPNARFATVFYDRVYAPVPLRRPGQPLPDWRDLRLGPQSVGYELTGPGRALVIGGGGGRDIYNALSSDQRRVDVIELNRVIRETVDRDLGRWSGAPYSLPRVHATDGDGRSALAARDTDYDQIHIGFTDTLSGSSAQGFALTEANLYTVEAFREYLDHLRPGGVLNVTRLHRLVGDEALRTTLLTLEALEREGVRNPERNVVVILGRDLFNELFGTVLARREPFTPADLALVRRLALQRGDGVAFAPGGPYALEWAQLARSDSRQEFCEGYRLDVCPPTDDRPFFFNMRRAGDIGRAVPAEYVYEVDPLLVLAVTLGILLVLSGLAFGLPLLLLPGAERPPIPTVSYFGAIGVGFLLLEVVLIQRFVLFLGFPTYALSVVLFSLLVFTGAGSLLSARLRRPRPALIAALAAAAAMIALAAFGLQPLLRGLIGLPFAARVAVTIAMLAPLGLVLGVAMPVGLRRLSGLYGGAVPWAWGINGVTSVLASVLAVAVAVTFGFIAVTLLALACYLAALAHAALGRWPTEDPSGPVRGLPDDRRAAALPAA
jgi:hypothetical protein